MGKANLCNFTIPRLFHKGGKKGCVHIQYDSSENFYEITIYFKSNVYSLYTSFFTPLHVLPRMYQVSKQMKSIKINEHQCKVLSMHAMVLCVQSLLCFCTKSVIIWPPLIIVMSLAVFCILKSHFNFLSTFFHLFILLVHVRNLNLKI